MKRAHIDFEAMIERSRSADQEPSALDVFFNNVIAPTMLVSVACEESPCKHRKPKRPALGRGIPEIEEEMAARDLCGLDKWFE